MLTEDGEALKIECCGFFERCHVKGVGGWKADGKS